MKRLLFTLLTAGCCSLTANAQDADMMKAWQAYMTPGDVHKMIAKADGTWSDETTMWMDPSTPMKSTGTSTNKMIMGGRYQLMNYKGTMMGQPFEGMGLLGYDNATKMFTNTWVDNMGTGTMTLKGSWDDATKSITFTGMMVDGMSGKETAVREVFTFIDNDHQTMEMFATVDGKEMKSMEIKSTRVKAKK